MENNQPRTFEIEEVIKRGWNVFKDNALMAIVGWLIAAVAMSVLGIAAGIFQQIGLSLRNDSIRYLLLGISVIVRLCNIPIQFWITGGMIFYFIKIVRGESFSLGDLFPTDIKKILNLIGANILIFLGVFIGLLFLIVPGIILALMWSQSIYFIMDQNMGPIEAMKASTQVMKGNKMTMFLLGLLLGVIGIVGTLITCGIGLLVLCPCFMLITACVYLIISGKDRPTETEGIEVNQV